ncbi:enoyl-CoA hydratase-related protein [Oceanibacterium hippocampi]|uniref:Carnitinyl-CoA dehydratase n=1 Tax=Oceanibacterium hippocampi TaxID=745714 RepID=A0A1Y5SL18_9PROT|nr:enoyl-CoA hydratase-related protein [Oceanibacterium hippocampi]SLN43270.1 Carnitinyl-CoA dehydratase [Oceanibacterium hippocampi]
MSILYEVADHVARVTIDRPKKLNAIDEASEAALQRIWTEIENDPEVRVVVLTGAGDRAFSAGADMSDSAKNGVAYWTSPRPGGFGGIAMRSTLDVPVIARVNGYALGGGFEMVLGCDIAIACEEAQMGLPEPRVGRLALDGGMVQLPRQIPRKLAMGMLLTGNRIKAPDAFRMGLLNEVVPRAELDAAVDRWVADILACAPLSLKAVKQVVGRTAHMRADEALAARLPGLVDALESEDGLEGVAAFMERRPPVWSGR